MSEYQPGLIPIDNLDEANKEIQRLRHMLSVAQVVRVDIGKPTITNGELRFQPVITAIGIDEEELATHVVRVLLACWLEILQQERAEAEEGQG